MEKRDLYDINRRLTGKTIYKGEEIPKGSYITVVLVYIQNSEGKFLFQKRSKRKNGLWATTGGHPKSGEDSLQGIITETKEEIGIDLDPNKVVKYYSGREDNEGVFWDDYYVKMDIPDIEKLELQESEVEQVKWFTAEEAEQLNQEGKFFKNHYEEFKILQNWLKNNQNQK